MSSPIVPLGELCDMDRQGLFPDDPIASGLPFVGVEHVESGSGAFNFNNGSRIGSQRSTTFRFDERHVLYAKLRPYLNKVATPGFAGRCSTELVPLLPRQGVHREFIAYLLRRSETVEYVMSSVTGARMPRTDMKALMSLHVPLPPLDEQRRIVGILNRAAKIGRLRAQARKLMGEFIPALFTRMFGGENPDAKHWPVYRIDQILKDGRRSIRTGPFGSQLKHSEFTDEGVPVLGIDNVVSNRFLWTKPRHIMPEKYASFQRYRVFPGDVVVTIMGTTGRVCVTPDNLPECMSTKHLCVLTLDHTHAEPFFVWAALLFDERVRRQTRIQAQGQIMEGWNLSIVRRLQLRVPPLNAQRSFSRIVARTLAMEASVSTQAPVASALGHSLISRLLEGYA